MNINYIKDYKAYMREEFGKIVTNDQIYIEKKMGVGVALLEDLDYIFSNFNKLTKEEQQYITKNCGGTEYEVYFDFENNLVNGEIPFDKVFYNGYFEYPQESHLEGLAPCILKDYGFEDDIAKKLLTEEEYEIFKKNNFDKTEDINKLEEFKMDISHETLKKHLAEQGYGLEKLVDEDSDFPVRPAIANHYFTRENLLTTKNTVLKKFMAEERFGLDVLVKDKNPEVRMEVAKQVYRLDILSEDKDPEVKKVALEIMKKISEKQKEEVNQIVDKNEEFSVRPEISKQLLTIENLLTTKDTNLKKFMAKENFGLDFLVYDENPEVRMEVAKQAYRLDILSEDKDPEVKKVALEMFEIKQFEMFETEQKEKMKAFLKENNPWSIWNSDKNNDFER